MLSHCRFFFIRIIYNTSFCQADSEDNFWYEAEKSVYMYVCIQKCLNTVEYGLAYLESVDNIR